MKLGIQPDIMHKPKEAFEFASNYGFSHIEILMDHPFYSMENLKHSELIELSETYDIEILIHAPSTSTNFLSISETMRKASYKELKRVLDFAKKCEAKVVTFHIGWNPGFITARGFIFPRELYSDHNYKVITTEMLRFLKNVDTSILALENTIDMDENLKKAIEVLLEQTDLKLTFDIGHYNCRIGHDIFLEHFDRVVNVHLHDNNGKIDEHKALGEGNVDLNIIPLSYRGYLTLEVRNVDAILQSKEYLKEILNI
ncbi:MAG TPA: sugar phosphate isomerase/epimerase [Archaeoglobus profundus]|nr:sugar phosphate isomerase/epimerase [Archaeoglobus profundus]